MKVIQCLAWWVLDLVLELVSFFHIDVVWPNSILHWNSSPSIMSYSAVVTLTWKALVWSYRRLLVTLHRQYEKKNGMRIYYLTGERGAVLQPAWSVHHWAGRPTCTCCSRAQEGITQGNGGLAVYTLGYYQINFWVNVIFCKDILIDRIMQNIIFILHYHRLRCIDFCSNSYTRLRIRLPINAIYNFSAPFLMYLLSSTEL